MMHCFTKCCYRYQPYGLARSHGSSLFQPPCSMHVPAAAAHLERVDGLLCCGGAGCGRTRTE